MCLRIKSITADSFKPNWASIASNAVRSSQAISIMREIVASPGVEASLTRRFLECVISRDDISSRRSIGAEIASIKATHLIEQTL